MSGKRRRPWIVRVTTGYEYDPAADKQRQKTAVIGYAATRTEAMQMLADYNRNPFDIEAAKATFQDVYDRWSAEKYPTVSRSNVNGYTAAYNVCTPLYRKAFKALRLTDLQHVVDSCGKNYPTLKKLKRDHNRFKSSEVDRLWEFADQPYYQIVLMLIYNGCRITEFLSLKKENINLESQYFDVVYSKTDNGIRRVPIADKVLSFYRVWYESSDCEYLLHTPAGEGFEYRNYYDSYWTPVMDSLGFKHLPHDTRHTCISMMTEAHVDQTMIKKIVGHSGAMTLTERVYTHLDVKALLEAINKI